ncbi:type VI secretion system baseplate subunit TssK [Halochromatium glycolicum]|uniref:Type VI secretion system-associated protein n=1 Tax=Halochromatium glycolicum TaxID=85075 RepID=A0AAJ0U690_9GAMM|nr:type VI secretion system baseplate subunit TssK [Halochromatium glycolicum]MBK1705550.1 type VI secretion system-associated protein [Halochromatium glycolicum]
MSWYSRVVWSEGMFLRPQHFQQQQRYTERFVEGRSSALVPFGWGLERFRIDIDQLSDGKVAIASAKGILPDGTPFDIPAHDPPPPALEIPESATNQLLYLSLPVRKENVTELAHEGTLTPTRQLAQELELRDITAADSQPAVVRISGLNLRLLTSDDERGDYACIAFARIIERRNNRQVILDEDFIPTVTGCAAAARLQGFIDELERLLRHRCEALAGRVAEASRGGNAEITDFMLLTVVNRYLPVLSHYRSLDPLHPVTLYRELIGIAGELATFTRQEKRPIAFPEYQHDNLQAAFEPVMRELRQALSMVLDRNAIPIPLQLRKFGVRVAAVFDRRLLTEATFCLIVKADMSVEEIRRIFPAQVKIGPVEKIRDLVNLALPGILLNPLPVAPRQLPFRSGAVYFELDRSSEFWKQLHNSGGFAIHVSGEFPSIDMEFWAIRE